MEVEGRCVPRFARLRDALRESLTCGAEVGAALAVFVDREPVVDLWGGWRDAARTQPWREDTIVNLYSVGKAVTAVCVHRLVEEGRLELDAPIARYWPEFAQAGKERLPVRFAMTHQSALPAVERALPPGAQFEWDVMTSALAAQAPWWPAGAHHGYHVNTQGFILGEVVRRVTGRTIGAWLREELAGPAKIDFMWGVPADLDVRCADVIAAPPGPESESLRAMLALDPATLSGLALMRFNAYRNPPDISGTGVVNTRAWRAAEIPSTNGHGNARGVARLYAALAGDGTIDGVHVLAPDTIAGAMREQVYGVDMVLQRPTRFGLGFQLTQAERPLGPGPRAFGHFGAGGSLGFADPDAHVAFAYAMNQGRAGWQHKHVREMIDMTYACLGER
jgi:CubicO group peptidase (beta-lactamase class C family)